MSVNKDLNIDGVCEWLDPYDALPSPGVKHT
jgi:hypothetical protein